MKKLTPEILEHAAKDGLFKFWDDDGDNEISNLNSYDFSLTPFCSRESMNWYSNAEIYAPKKKVKSCVDTMKALIDGGWKPDEDGHFRKKDNSNFFPRMWEYCEKEPSNVWNWDPSWLEDVREQEKSDG